MQSDTRPQRIAVAAHPNLPEAMAEAEHVARSLLKHGLNPMICTSLYDERLRAMVQAGDLDLVIALGGDGTMLRAGRLCAPQDIPILGINVGHFGFLTELQRSEWPTVLPALLDGRYRLEKRMMLRAGHCREDHIYKTWDVLNEVVVCRGNIVRPIRLSASVDGYLMTSYVADGLIASTPTGSTAYALAVGGPVMPPELRSILIIPVAPHLSFDRAAILPDGVHVTITVHTNHEAVVSVDGQAPETMQDGDCIQVSAGPHCVSFVRFEDPGYFYRNLSRYMEQNPTAGKP
jgi:NAD+ kinase